MKDAAMYFAREHKGHAGTFEAEYDAILEKAGREYEDEPPSDYYREGYLLYKRLSEYKENQLLFLHDPRVPANNSLSERLARNYKRKQKQAIVIRSDDSLGFLCESMSVMYMLKAENKSVYEEITKIFNRERPVNTHRFQKQRR